MALFGDQGDDDDAPKRGSGGVFAQKAGPLPVWGWAAVAVAAVFLWRRIAGGAGDKKADATSSAPVPFPTGGVGGVFLIPQSAGAAPTVPSTPGIATSTVPASVVAQADAAIQHQLLGGGYTQDQKNKRLAEMAASPAAGFFKRASSGSPAVAEMFRSTAARRAAGLPYLAAGAGNTLVVKNPATGAVLPIASFAALDADTRAGINAGYAQSWTKALTPAAGQATSNV